MFVWDGTKDERIAFTNHTVTVVAAGEVLSLDMLTVRKDGKNDWSLFYCEKGYIHFEDIDMTVGPGQLLIYPPNIPQKYIIYKAENTVYQYLHFTGNDIKSLITSLNITTMSPFDSPNELILGIIKKIQKALVYDDAYSSVKAEYLTLQLLTMLAKRSPHISKKNMMLRVTEEMNNTFPLPYDASKFAKMFSVSVSRFNHLFKEIMGISPLNYYIKLRMDNACLLLECTDLSISEISQRVGYEEPLYFRQVFKKHIGVSPSSYQKAYRRKLNSPDIK